MKRNWSTVDILRHSRHDWLNNLQLIKGNLDLNKVDRVKEIIAEIVIEAKHEANLTNLNIPTFSGSLMTYNWGNHHFQVEFEILGDIRDLSAYDDSLTEWTFTYFEMLDQFVSAEGENHLSLSIDLSNSEIRFFFDFSGIINEVEKLENWLHKHEENRSVKIIEKNVCEKEMSIVLILT